MSKIRVLAVEDDSLHEEKLRMVIDKLGYDLIDVIKNPGQLMTVISATQPDILLMDIDLGNNISGIDLVEKVNKVHDIPVVFLTSFIDDKTFQEAKKTIPAAYVTKPYNSEDLKRAIELAVITNQKNSTGMLNRLNRSNNKEFIFIKKGNNLLKLAVSDIILIEAYDKYCFLYVSGMKHMIKERLKNILEHLPAFQFCQVHRSYVINIAAIENIELKQNKIIVMGKAIGIGKTYKHNLMANVSLLG